ncbi:MAG TPA: class I SAM-dependent methyltransferase [Clostridiales bacterium UBA8153]|nr:class I SAM-dependent methyltransferase [Clostridiales bacterium UBA8153]
MSDKPWYESYFGEDYFEIYRGFLPLERTVAQVEGIISLLGLAAGARILDLACGHGRHAIPLSRRLYDVTGYDLSAVFLERARAEASAQGAPVRWIQGDMRELPFDAEFDAVINIFTSFGYFADPEDDVRTLHGVRRALRPGGMFLLETMHRDGLLGRFQQRWFDRTANGSIVLHEVRWDLARDVLDDHVTLLRPDGSQTAYRTSLHLRSLAGFLALMREAGLVPEAWYGGLDGSPLDLSSRRLVLISRRGE